MKLLYTGFLLFFSLQQAADQNQKVVHHDDSQKKFPGAPRKPQKKIPRRGILKPKVLFPPESQKSSRQKFLELQAFMVSHCPDNQPKGEDQTAHRTTGIRARFQSIADESGASEFK